MKSVKMVVALSVVLLFVLSVAVRAAEAAAPASTKDAAEVKADVKEMKDANKAQREDAKADRKADEARKEEAKKIEEGKPMSAKDAAEVKADVKAMKEDKKETKEAAKEEKEAVKPTLDIIATADKMACSKLIEALNTAGLTDTLKGKGPFTLLAPSDAAFAKMPKAELDALMKDKTKLADVLKLHIIEGALTGEELAKAKEVKTLGGTLPVVAKEGKVTVGGVEVNTGDHNATNGVIHGIDGLLKK